MRAARVSRFNSACRMRINIMEIPVNSLYDASALKKPANVSVNADLLLKAKSLHINLSAALDVLISGV